MRRIYYLANMAHILLFMHVLFVTMVGMDVLVDISSPSGFILWLVTLSYTALCAIVVAIVIKKEKHE